MSPNTLHTEHLLNQTPSVYLPKIIYTEHPLYQGGTKHPLIPNILITATSNIDSSGISFRPSERRHYFCATGQSPLRYRRKTRTVRQYRHRCRGSLEKAGGEGAKVYYQEVVPAPCGLKADPYKNHQGPRNSFTFNYYELFITPPPPHAPETNKKTKQKLL